MGFFDSDNEHSRAHEEYQSTPKHESKISHELLAGAGTFAAMKAFEDHQEKNGKVVDHKLAKELIAGLAGAFLDKEFETHGLNFIDKEKAKYQAKKQAHQEYERHYEN